MRFSVEVKNGEFAVLIGDRIRAIREAKHLSQGDIERRSRLLRSYISRVENGYTVPSVETLEKFARALEVPLYQLFYEGEEPPRLPRLLKRKTAEEIVFGRSREEGHFLARLSRLLARIKKRDQQLLLQMAQKMATR